MFTSNPFAELSAFISPQIMQGYVILMVLFVIGGTVLAIMICGYPTPEASTPTILPALWHIGALMLAIGGYWFWFSIRVDVSAEGLTWYRFERADLFIVSLLSTATFALIWSYTQSSGIAGWSTLFFVLYIVSATVVFAGVYFSKFAHMFFKPAAAYQKRVTKADGSRENLPLDYDLTDPAVQAKFPDIPEYMGKEPAYMGRGIKRESANHY
jgi:hypothetical protein